MKLFGRGQSRSIRGVWALLECGLDFEYVHVDPDNLDGYAALNSQSKVPTFWLTEIEFTSVTPAKKPSRWLKPSL